MPRVRSWLMVGVIGVLLLFLTPTPSRAELMPMIIQDPSPYGYVSLAGLGVTPFTLPSNADDGGFVLNVPMFSYLGVDYTSLIWSVNGTIEPGTASGVTSSFANTSLPNAGIPNNLLAPWWTDLDLSAGGHWYVAALSDGINQYLVLEWEDVPRFDDLTSTFTFQTWIQIGTDNIWFVYDAFTGDTGDGTVGAEDPTGRLGDTYYFDGSGTSPWGGPDLRIVAVAVSEPTTLLLLASGLAGLGALRWRRQRR